MTAFAGRQIKQEISAGGQTSLVLLGLLAALTLCLGVVPAILAASGVAIVAGSSQRRRAARATVVVGDAPFCLRAGSQLRRRGRQVSELVLVDGLPMEIPASSEVVVDGRSLAKFWDLAAVPDGRTSVKVAPQGRPDSSAVDEVLSVTERILKRTVDIVGAGLGLLLCLPVLLIAAAAIKLDSPGPVLFRQERVGQAGRRFRIFKLRTMRTDNDGSEHLAYVAALMRGDAKPEDGVFKLTRDPRITRVGRLLRRLSIDELPQLVNVLRGDMSLVGPRPPMVEEARLYDDWAWQRLRVKPGLTGLWQISGRCELDFRDMVALDLRYQEAWSPLLELRILLKTPAAVLSSRGAA